MQIFVTTDDLREAQVYVDRLGKENGLYTWRNWNNPITIAIERAYNGKVYATANESWIGLASRDSDRHQRLPASGQVELWIREWCRGVASPASFSFGLIAP